MGGKFNRIEVKLTTKLISPTQIPEYSKFIKNLLSFDLQVFHSRIRNS